MNETMLAAVFKGEGKLVLEERPVPQIKAPNDVLIAIKGVGVCGTDLHILEIPPRHPATEDVIMGHEFCGEVMEVGSQVTNCTPGIFHDGALAKYIVVPDYMVYQVGSNVPWHHMAITETVACAFNALRKADPEMGETAVVLGAGPVGLLLTSMLKSSGVRVITSEVAPSRAKVAETVGADVVVNPKEQDLTEIVNAETGGHGADIVLEAVGPLLNECIELARFGGRVVLFGHDELARPAVPQALIMRKELQMFGVFLAKYTFVPTIRLLEQDMLPLDEIVSHVMALDEIFEAHAMMKAGEAIKVVIDPTM